MLVSANLYNDAAEPTGGNDFLQGLTYFLCMVICPLSFSYYVWNNINLYQWNKFNSRQGSLFDDIELRTKWKSAYYLVYVVRRILFIEIAFGLKDWPGIQIQFVNYLNLATLIYIGSFSPLLSRPRNNLEMFNEFCICFVSFVFMSFTNVISNDNTKWKFGEIIIWAILYFLYVTIMVVLAYNAKMITIMS